MKKYSLFGIALLLAGCSSLNVEWEFHATYKKPPTDETVPK